MSATAYLTTRKPHSPTTSSNAMPPTRRPSFVSEMTSRAKSTTDDDGDIDDGGGGGGRGRGEGVLKTGGVDATMLLPLRPDVDDLFWDRGEANN